MNTKGQIAGQIFIYIMAVIVIGAIALVGYKAINGVVGKSCDAEKAVFKGNIEELIEKYTSYGSVNKKTLKAPCEYDTICFVDASMTNINTALGTKNQFRCPSNKLIEDSVKNNVETNIFVKSEDRTVPVGYSELVSLNIPTKGNLECLCIESKNGNFYMTFNGKGSTTEISSGIN